MALRHLLTLKLNEATGPFFTYLLILSHNSLNVDLELVRINKYSFVYYHDRKLYQLSILDYVVICSWLGCIILGWI